MSEVGATVRVPVGTSIVKDQRDARNVLGVVIEVGYF